MKLIPDKCPTHGLPWNRIAETVLVTARLLTYDDGTYDYTGDSDVHWDTQAPEVVEDEPCRGLESVRVGCPRCSAGEDQTAQIEGGA